MFHGTTRGFADRISREGIIPATGQRAPITAFGDDEIAGCISITPLKENARSFAGTKRMILQDDLGIEGSETDEALLELDIPLRDIDTLGEFLGVEHRKRVPLGKPVDISRFTGEDEPHIVTEQIVLQKRREEIQEFVDRCDLEKSGDLVEDFIKCAEDIGLRKEWDPEDFNFLFEFKVCKPIPPERVRRVTFDFHRLRRRRR